MSEILASPAEVPSPLPSSDNFRLLASTTDWSINQQFMDLETRLFERQEKMSETLRLVTQVLNVLSSSVNVKTVTPPPKPFQSQLRPVLPQLYNRSCSSRKFIHACQAHFRLRPDQFPDEQTKVQWAMTYMSRGRAKRWVTRVYDWEMLLANTGVNYFVDWDDFQLSFRKEFFPLHAEAVATNALEGTAYFQGIRTVDNYLDEFRDLVSASRYTSPKTIVVKFRRGLDTSIGDVITTMAVSCPDDLDLEAWFEAAVRIDQACATNAAFWASVQPVTAVPKVDKKLPPPTKVAEVPQAVPAPSPLPLDVLDIKGMLVDNIRALRQRLFGILEEFPVPPAPVDVKQIPTPMAPKTTDTLPTFSANRFQKLPVEEISETTSAPPVTAEAACKRPPRRPQWERRLPKQPTIGAAEIGPNSLYLKIEIESTQTQRKYGIRALVDSGATGLFIDREYVKSNQIPTRKLSVVIPVYNVDGTTNTAGSISEVVELLLRYN